MTTPLAEETDVAAPFDAAANYNATRAQVGYIPRAQATADTYAALGFKCGLEIHQQLNSPRKLFCHCPTGIYQEPGDFDAEVIRHMRPTLSELGEYDGTALMEFKTRKEITYRIKNETACTYDIDDTPPFPIDPLAIDIAIEIALSLKMNIVGELHITRKQYLDGSIPTGFQRTGIIGIEGEFPLPHKTIRIIQMSLEEDSCREVSDIGHKRIYRTDRLGMPLIETVTYPDMLTPNEAAEAAHHLRFVARSSNKVRTGIGAARQDVNVSVTGGTRVEIKGVAHIPWIPELTHNEAFRQKALLNIADELGRRIDNPDTWQLTHRNLDAQILLARIARPSEPDSDIIAINLPRFAGILSYFTGPGRMFGDELADRLKVIACLERPNLFHSEQLEPQIDTPRWQSIREQLNANPDDAQLVIWGLPEDLKTAIETIDERCRLAMQGVPNETRKSLLDGTTIFERVLPGPDRMYPDTDSAPIPITQERVDRIAAGLAPAVAGHRRLLTDWNAPADTHAWLLRENRVGLIEQIAATGYIDPRRLCIVMGHTLRHLEGQSRCRLDNDTVRGLFSFTADRRLDPDIISELFKQLIADPGQPLAAALDRTGYKSATLEELNSRIAPLHEQFKTRRTSKAPDAAVHWIMGQLRPPALGNIALAELRTHVEKTIGHD